MERICMDQRVRRMITKNKIISVCVQLFLKKGYYKTTMLEITKKAEVSLSSFQNLFRTKDGVLLDIAEIMLEKQLNAIQSVVADIENPVHIYALETAIQITMTELDERLRDLYVAVYSNDAASEYIYANTTTALNNIFEQYNSDYTMSDFYELNVGGCGITRNYMARKCDPYFTLEKKLDRFLAMSLKIYNIPDAEIQEAIDFVMSMDIRTISHQIMQQIFEALSVQFNFTLDEIEQSE